MSGNAIYSGLVAVLFALDRIFNMHRAALNITAHAGYAVIVDQICQPKA